MNVFLAGYDSGTGGRASLSRLQDSQHGGMNLARYGFHEESGFIIVALAIAVVLVITKVSRRKF